MNALWMGLAVLAGVVLIMKFSLGGGDRSTAKEKIGQGATVIDVRSQEEYRSGHYQGAKNIPVGELQRRLSEVGDKKKAVVVYCASGMRSAQAAKFLTDAGFTDVTNAGGLKSLMP